MACGAGPPSALLGPRVRLPKVGKALLVKKILISVYLVIKHLLP